MPELESPLACLVGPRAMTPDAWKAFLLLTSHMAAEEITDVVRLAFVVWGGAH
jgi:hypothetical protein